MWACVFLQTNVDLCGLADLFVLTGLCGLVWSCRLMWACVDFQTGVSLCVLAVWCGLA